MAALLPRMLNTYARPIRYACPVLTWPPGEHTGALRPVTRAIELRKGTDGWMSSLIARLPLSTGDIEDSAAEVYLDALAEVLADGKLTGDEARHLAHLAGSAGMGGAQVAALNRQFLEMMRAAALDDEVLTRTELRQLTAAAKALGASEYFHGLEPTTPAPAAPNSASTPRGSSDYNGDQRSARLERARAALKLQQEGWTRSDIAAHLQTSADTVKSLLRDAKFHANPQSDPSRLNLARSALAARGAGLHCEQFQQAEAISRPKAAEAWRDADVLRDYLGT